MANELTIGRLAQAAGVTVETIRYYQRRGLLDKPGKPKEGYRRYSSEAAKRLRFIKRAQALGFTLEEISNLLLLEETDCCASTQKLAARKLALIEVRLADLTAMRDVLAGLVSQCDAGTHRGGCPIISSLVNN